MVVHRFVGADRGGSSVGEEFGELEVLGACGAVEFDAGHVVTAFGAET